MGLLFVAGILGVIPAMIAAKKGREAAAWWIYGTLLFVIALPHSLLLEPSPESIERRAKASGLRKCPFCAELIKLEAKVCRYCGRDVPAVRIDAAAVTASLVEQLYSSDLKVKDKAIIALGDRGAASRHAEAALRELLDDPVSRVRSRAKWALETIARATR